MYINFCSSHKGIFFYDASHQLWLFLIASDYLLVERNSKVRKAAAMDDTDDIVLDPPKVVKYGPAITKRFMSKTSLLHDQQKEALESLGDWFINNRTKNYTAVVVMPTGTGKTGVICCLPYFLGPKVKDINFYKPILVITPGLAILHQMEDNLSSGSPPFLMRHGFIKLPKEEPLGYTLRSIMTTMDVPKLTNSTSQYDIVLTNAQKWRKTTDKNNPTSTNYADLPEDLFSVIVVDEAHHLPANQWKEIIEKFKPHAKVVFFTATPERADGKPITEDLKEVGYAYQLSREEAIKENLIRAVNKDIIPFDDDEPPPTKKPKYELLDKEIKRFMRKNENMMYTEKILSKVKEYIERKNLVSPLPGNKKHAAMIIACSIDEAEEIKGRCINLGFLSGSVEVVHSEKNKYCNEKIVKDIKLGKYKVVIIVKMLLEGFDHPPFSIAGIATKIRSPVKFSQFIGRVQRVVREGGKKEENIEADVISHAYFEQEKQFEKYIKPVIRVKKDEEDKSLDEEDPLDVQYHV